VHQGLIPNSAGGFNGQLFFFLMANIGTTIAHGCCSFSKVQLSIRGCLRRTSLGTFRHATRFHHYCGRRSIHRHSDRTVLPGIDIDDAAQAAHELMKTDRYVGTFLAIGLFDAGLLGAICISLASSWPSVRFSAGRIHSIRDPPSAVVLCNYF